MHPIPKLSSPPSSYRNQQPPQPSSTMANTITNEEQEKRREEERESMKRAIAREAAGPQPLKFLDLPNFPINSPKLNNVRIIDTDNFHEQTAKRHLRCIDAAATLLYKCDRDALSKFLNPKIEKFSFFRGDGWHLPFKLIRTRNIIEVISPHFINSVSCS